MDFSSDKPSEETIEDINYDSTRSRYQALSGINGLDNNQEYQHFWSLKDPLFVILCASDARKDKPNRRQGSFRRVLEEIEFIKRNYNHIEVNDDLTSDPGFLSYLSKQLKRPILVCGYFEETGLKPQKNSLKQLGYDAYISIEGSCRIINPYNPPDNPNEPPAPINPTNYDRTRRKSEKRTDRISELLTTLAA